MLGYLITKKNYIKTYMKNILITGASGQLAMEIHQELPKSATNHYIFTTRNELDVTNVDKINAFFKKHNIELVINCAAYTNVNGSEMDKETANLVNHLAVKNIAQACTEHKSACIHLSTDYVFAGDKNTPYTETDATSPLGAYGQTKLLGESALQHSDIDFLILRTSWLYSAFGNNFVKNILRISKERKELKVVFDQVSTPTYAKDLARFIIFVIENKLYRGRQDVYHFSNEGVCSWYDFAVEILKLAGSVCMVIPCRTEDFPTPAARPAYSVLDKNKLKTDFNFFIPYWRDSLISLMSQNTSLI